jgi:hypothetical protein
VLILQAAAMVLRHGLLFLAAGRTEGQGGR